MPDVHVVAYLKGEQRYIALYEDRHATEAIRTLGRWAAHPDLSLTWFDCARMTASIADGQRRKRQRVARGRDTRWNRARE
jgi:hypothetical protein